MYSNTCSHPIESPRKSPAPGRGGFVAIIGGGGVAVGGCGRVNRYLSWGSVDL